MLEVKKSGAYDFALAIATITVFVALSAISIYGTIVSWLNSVSDPNWTQTALYGEYLQNMNSYAYPFAVALILILCMCIPKRFIPRSYLLQSSVLLLALSAVVGIVWGFVAGLAFLLVVSVVIQTVVAVLVVMRSKSLVFEREGILVQLGSALLHLGFVIFALDLLLVKDPANHIDVFWSATALIMIGSVFSFYSREIASVAKGATRRRAAADAYPEVSEVDVELMPTEQPALDTEE